MAKTQLVSAVPQGQKPPISGASTGAARPMGRIDFDELDADVGGSINSIRGEIDDAFADIKTFPNREPDEIMRIAAGHSARLSEIRVRIMRIEDYRTQWRNVRTRELEPTLEELQRQWSHGSRLHSVRELDWRMEAGER